MILFFGDSKSKVFAVETSVKLSAENLEKISWALNSPIINKDIIEEKFIGPKSSMISPWSTNAVEIAKAASKKIGGKGGGGRPDFAQAGGDDSSKIDDAFEKIKNLI